MVQAMLANVLDKLVGNGPHTRTKWGWLGRRKALALEPAKVSPVGWPAGPWRKFCRAQWCNGKSEEHSKLCTPGVVSSDHGEWLVFGNSSGTENCEEGEGLLLKARVCTC